MSLEAVALELERVSIAFAAVRRGAPPYVALGDVSLRLGAGEFLSIVGPTGCGKSTLLNVAAGLSPPTTGAVRVFGRQLDGLNRAAGYLFQTDTLLPWRTALENIVVGLDLRGVPRAEALARGRRWLAQVGLAGFGDHYPPQLSGGMRKRIALAQTLIVDPQIVLMDEPFSALDVQTRQLMENELLALWQMDRKSVLFITHDLEEAIALSDRVLVLSAGPGTRVIGEFAIDLPRPRDVAEIRLMPDFVDVHRRIWEAMRQDVLKSHARATA